MLPSQRRYLLPLLIVAIGCTIPLDASRLSARLKKKLEASANLQEPSFLQTLASVGGKKKCDDNCDACDDGKGCSDSWGKNLDGCCWNSKDCDGSKGCSSSKCKGRGCVTPSPTPAPTPTPPTASTPSSPPTSPTPAPTPTPPTASTPSSPPTTETTTDWVTGQLALSTYWDCSGQGCDADDLSPFDTSLYVSPAGYGPQDPNDFEGGSLYGESLWMFGAPSDSLTSYLGGDECHKCVLLKNEAYSLNPSMEVLVMFVSSCPGSDNPKCNLDTFHIDLLVPGFDYPCTTSGGCVSTANICGDTSVSGLLGESNGGLTNAQSTSLGDWNYDAETGTLNYADTTAAGAALCSGLAADFQGGCERFSTWGWTTGMPGYEYPAPDYQETFTGDVSFKVVSCPSQLEAWADLQFSEAGPAANDLSPSDL